MVEFSLATNRSLAVGLGMGDKLRLLLALPILLVDSTRTRPGSVGPSVTEILPKLACDRDRLVVLSILRVEVSLLILLGDRLCLDEAILLVDSSRTSPGSIGPCVWEILRVGLHGDRLRCLDSVGLDKDRTNCFRFLELALVRPGDRLWLRDLLRFGCEIDSNCPSLDMLLRDCHRFAWGDLD